MTQPIQGIVLVGGCFDILHYGHIHFLTQAKQYASKLIVMLESDLTVRRLKGQNRPIHTQEQRKIMLEALRVVDEVVTLFPMETDGDYLRVIADIHPRVIVATQGDPILEKKKTQAETVGAKLITVAKIQTPSTTDIIRNFPLG